MSNETIYLKGPFGTGIRYKGRTPFLSMLKLGSACLILGVAGISLYKYKKKIDIDEEIRKDKAVTQNKIDFDNVHTENNRQKKNTRGEIKKDVLLRQTREYSSNCQTESGVSQLSLHSWIEKFHSEYVMPDYSTIPILADVLAVGDASKTGFYQRKFLDETMENYTNIDAKRSSTPWVVFRLGEIYLNRAEACVELNQHLNEALNDINEIRGRAGIKLLTASELTLEKVRRERKVELAFERHRYWDLKRWRKSHLDVSQGGLTNFRGTALCPYYNIKSGKYTFETGIPAKRIRLFTEKNYYTGFRPEDLSTNPLMVQNPGHEN